MRIALLSFEYPPETGFGGIGSYTWHHARALVKLGHEVHVLAGAREATPLRSGEHDGVRVHRFWADGAAMYAYERLGAFRLWWTRQRLQNAWSMYRGISALHREHRYDVLEMPECGAEGALVTRLLKVPTVVKLHSPSRLIMPYYDVRPADIWLCSTIEQRALENATALTACSRFVADEVALKMGIHRHITVVRNGLDLEWFDRAAEPADVHLQYGLPRRRLLIVFTGRMERRKGIHLCPEIASSILERFDVTFVLAGDDLFGYVAGTLLPALAARPLKGSIHWLGALPMADLRRLVRAADIVLLPSLWENCPYSCLEAMAAGRAVVCADQGGMPELIQSGVNGLLATPGDAPSFVRRIEQLIEDAALRIALGHAARETIQRVHGHAHVARQALRVYQKVTAGNERGNHYGRASSTPRGSQSSTAGPDPAHDTDPLPEFRVVIGTPSWAVNGVNVFSTNLVRGLLAASVPAHILLTEDNTAMIHSSETLMPCPAGVPFLSLPVSPADGWGGHWGEMVRYLEDAAPCVYIPNYDWRHSCVCPRLSDEVVVVGIVHSDDPLHYDHVRRLGPFWNVVVAVSSVVAERTVEACPSVADRIVTIPIGVPIPPVRPQRARTTGALRLVYHGALRQPQKRVLDLIRIVEAASDLGVPVVLSIAGAGPDEAALRIAGAPLVDRGLVRFLGVISPDDTAAMLETQDVYLLASEFEGMPNALIEAMGRGCVPVVTRVTSGIPELIRDGDNGFLVPIGDAGAFAERLRTLWNDPARREQMSIRAFQTVEKSRFHVEDMVRSYQQVFERAWSEMRAGRFVRPRGPLAPPPPTVAGASLFPVELPHMEPGLGAFPSAQEAERFRDRASPKARVRRSALP